MDQASRAAGPPGHGGARSHHGRTRWRAALPFETTHNLACSPGRVSIAHRKYALFRHRVTAAGHRMWTTRAIGQLSIAALPSPKPLVADVRADPEPPAQLTYVRALLHCQSDKLTPLVHDRHLLPRHERPPSRAESCHYDVSVMSSDTRQS